MVKAPDFWRKVMKWWMPPEKSKREENGMFRRRGRCAAKRLQFLMMWSRVWSTGDVPAPVVLPDVAMASERLGNSPIEFAACLLEDFVRFHRWWVNVCGVEAAGFV